MSHHSVVYEQLFLQLEILCTHLADSILHLRLLGDVCGVKGHVVVPLHDIKRGHNISSGHQLLDNVPAQKSAASDDEIDIFAHTFELGLWRIGSEGCAVEPLQKNG